MSLAPNSAAEDLGSGDFLQFRKANARRSELIRNGMSNSGSERNCCFLNTHTARFANISSVAGLDHIGDGRAYALVDWDHDGDLDLWASNRTGPRVQFLRNNSGGGNHFLELKLQGNGTTSTRDAIGSRVEVVLGGADDLPLVKTIHAGEGFLGQSSKTLHFGLGSTPAIEKVIVHWPGGERQEFNDLSADQLYILEQNNASARTWSRAGELAVLAAGANELHDDSVTQSRIPLAYRMPLPELIYESLEGEAVAVGKQSQQPRLVNLWASWCQPCMQELADMKKRAKELRSAGLEVIALSVDKLAVDDTSSPDAARSFLKRQEFPFAAGFATPELIEKLETEFYFLYDFERPWSVPTSFLIDGRGQLAVVYVGRVEVDQLIADTHTLAQNDQDWLAAALPFVGRWLSEAIHPDLTNYIATFLDRGHTADAYEFVDQFGELLVHDPQSSPLFVRSAMSHRTEGHLDQAAEQFRLAVKADPSNATACLRLAQFLAQEQKLTVAKQWCLKALELQPDLAEAHYILAKLLTAEGNHEQALREYEESVQLLPDSLPVRIALGLAYIRIQQWEAAAEQFQTATELDSDSMEAHLRLAMSLQKAGKTRQALPVFEKASALAPENGNIRYSYGAAFVELRDYEKALEQFREAYQLEPDSLPTLNGLAWLLATTQSVSSPETKQAVALALEAAKKTGFSHPQVLMTLAAAYAADGDFNEAITTANKAIQIAEQGKAPQLVEQLRSQLELYRKNQPLRTP